MSQVTLAQILRPGGGRYAVGAFNVHNLEFIKGVVNAAERAGKPVILMINEAVLHYGGLSVLGAAALGAAGTSSVPVAVMVDHGSDIRLLEAAVKADMDVMYDGSMLPFEENVANTRYMADFAHRHGRSLEGEIGALGLTEDGEEEREQKLTTVDEAREFYLRSGVDVLAVSVGNCHGFYRGKADINLTRVQEISAAVNPLPVVMHGGSDIPEETIRAAVRAGIRKFNFATDLKKAYADKMWELACAKPRPIQPLQLFPPLAEAVAKAAKEKMDMLWLED